MKKGTTNPHVHVHRVRLEPMFHPVVSGTIRVRRGSDHTGHPFGRAPAAREHSLEALVRGPVAEFFPADPRIFVTVIVPVIVRFLKLAQKEFFASRPRPNVFRMVEFRIRPDLRKPFLGLTDHVRQLFIRLTEENAFPSGSISLADVHSEGHQ